MDIQLLVDYVYQYGYLALFLFLWLGIVGMPLPDEVIVMGGGFVTSLGILEPLPAFFVTYAGVVSGLTLGYVIGRIIGFPAIEYLRKKKKVGNHIEKAQQLIDKYGTTSLVLSYFFPVVRHVVPYIVGINKMPYSAYAMYSYTAGLIWTVFYFILGRYFGDSIEMVYALLSKYLWLFFVIGIVMIILRKHSTIKQERKINA